MQTHHWLKYYVSMRLKDRSLPRGSFQGKVVLLTYLTSAIWHGPDSGYVVFFVGAALCDIFGRTIGGTALANKLMQMIPYPITFAILLCWHQFTISYTGICFPLLDFDKWNAVHRNFGYCLHYIIPVGIIIASLLPKAPRKKTATTATDSK